jgi:hypothetical protein
MPSFTATPRSTISWKFMVQRFRYVSFLGTWTETSVLFVVITCQMPTCVWYPRTLRSSADWSVIVSAENQEDTDDGIGPSRDTRVRVEPRRGPIPARLWCYTGAILFPISSFICFIHKHLFKNASEIRENGANLRQMEQGMYHIAKWNGTKVSVKILDRDGCSDQEAA